MARRDIVANVRLSYRPVALQSVMGGRKSSNGHLARVCPCWCKSTGPAHLPCSETPATRPYLPRISVLGRQRVAAIRSPGVEGGRTG